MTSRRSFLHLLLLGGAATLAVACGQSAAPAAAPTTAPAAPSTPPASAPANTVDASWDKIVADAKNEGTVAVASYAGTVYRQIADAFEAANPGIKVDLTQFQSSSRDFEPRLLQELKASLYTWDLAFMPAQEQLRQTRPIDGLIPVRGLLRSDLMQNKVWNWANGFDDGFPDIDKKWGYSLVNQLFYSVWVNTDQVGPNELIKVDEVFDPKWRGKILAADPRTKGAAFSALTAMRVQLHDDSVVTRLFKEQAPSIGIDARQQTEMMVRGRYPISFGAVDEQILKDFLAQGLGKNLTQRQIPETGYFNSGNHTAWALNHAPHPNAAIVYLNWILTPEAAQLYARLTQYNSARVEVPTVNPLTSPQKGVTYFKTNDEVNLGEIEKTQALARDLLD